MPPLPLKHALSSCKSPQQQHPPFSAHDAASSRVKCGSCMSTGSRCHSPCFAIWLISMAAGERACEA